MIRIKTPEVTVDLTAVHPMAGEIKVEKTAAGYTKLVLPVQTFVGGSVKYDGDEDHYGYNYARIHGADEAWRGVEHGQPLVIHGNVSSIRDMLQNFLDQIEEEFLTEE